MWLSLWRFHQMYLSFCHLGECYSIVGFVHSSMRFDVSRIYVCSFYCILSRRQVYCIRQRQLRCKIMEYLGSRLLYAERPHRFCMVRCILSERQISCIEATHRPVVEDPPMLWKHFLRASKFPPEYCVLLVLYF